MTTVSRADGIDLFPAGGRKYSHRWKIAVVCCLRVYRNMYRHDAITRARSADIYTHLTLWRAETRTANQRRCERSRCTHSEHTSPSNYHSSLTLISGIQISFHPSMAAWLPIV